MVITNSSPDTKCTQSTATPLVFKTIATPHSKAINFTKHIQVVMNQIMLVLEETMRKLYVTTGDKLYYREPYKPNY
jgi:hypothetical protein